MAERARSLPRPAAQGSALRTLRHRDFRNFWLGWCAAVLGFQIQRVGLAVLAYDLTGSALYLALVFSGDSIPMVLLSPIGGALSDRIDRKALLLVSRCCVAVLALALAVLVATGVVEAWHLVVFALLTGVCYALDVPARQAMLHDLVPDNQLVSAIALTATARQASRIIGPAVGGGALWLIGTQGTFALQAVSQAAMVLMVFTVRLPHVPRGRGTSMATDLADGLRFIAQHRVVCTLMAVTAVPALSAMAYQALTPVFAEDVLGLGDSAIGLMLAAAGAGAVAGSLLVTAHPERWSTPGISAGMAVLFGLVVAAFALSRSVALSLVLLAGAGLANAVYSIGVSSAIQRRTPSALQGRVMGAYQTTWELQVAGSLAVGALVDVIGAPVALALAGVASAGLTALLLPAVMRPPDRPPV